ncbi:hypothetical protein EV356DRAFT_511776 [Viridothelium virens]|uniref:Uncharacterized protein n=1 Tax=Viridothelium virens TaxID=1048519 RepID=A0A6A6GUW0_VIRVR|nr:hypothetical protein EV356DRAFT_511776 [Viridothelium virens]
MTLDLDYQRGRTQQHGCGHPTAVENNPSSYSRQEEWRTAGKSRRGNYSTYRSRAAPPKSALTAAQPSSKFHQASISRQETLCPSKAPKTWIGSTVFDMHPGGRGWTHGYTVKQKIEEGAVILAPYIAPLLDTKIPLDAPGRAETEVGAACAKHRPYIILSKHLDHFQAIPLWTYQSRGLEGKPQEVQAEHVSLARPGNRYELQTPHKPLWLEASSKFQVSEKCVARFTEVHAFSFSCSILLLGYINRESYIRLTELHLKDVHVAIEMKVSRIKEELNIHKNPSTYAQSPRHVRGLPGTNLHRLEPIAA